MDDKINLLITLSDKTQLLRVALKLTQDLIGDIMPYYLEPENKEKLKSLLPLYCQTAGEIVEVQEIFTIIDLTIKGEISN
jgi:hypothetical protein